MALFPAYAPKDKQDTKDEEEKEPTSKYSTFIPPPPEFNIESRLYESDSSSSDVEMLSDYPMPQPVPLPQASSSKDKSLATTDSSNSKKKKHKKEKKKKKKHKHEKESKQEDSQLLIPLDKDYYVDIKPQKIYNTCDTLHRPARPRYFISEYRIGPVYAIRPKTKRYYIAAKKLNKTTKEVPLEPTEAEEENYLKHLRKNPQDVEQWVKYIEYKFASLRNVNNFQREKTMLDIEEKASKLNPENQNLLQGYLNRLTKVYPTDKVLDLIEEMVNKDAKNYTLWNALIYNKQASMAQCMVPDVLELYKRCMTTLFSVIRSDEILVKIFKNCAIFLRQSGLWEQFFALIHLALNLNVSTTAFTDPETYTSTPQNPDLLELEDAVLESGLPMNEIWLRVEKLRAAFNFLPCSSQGTSDPQRIVLNEDICHFIFPLINQKFSFDFFILVLKMLKYPFDTSLFESSSFFLREVQEYDNIEEILPVFLEPKRDCDMDRILFEMVKDMNVPPSFINNNLAYESYLETILNIILSACSCVTAKQKLILFKLYIRLERIIAVLAKLGDALKTSGDKLKIKNRIKAAIERVSYKENLQVYNEFAWVEYELNGFEAAEHVLTATMSQNFVDSVDYSRLCLSYVELLLTNNQHGKAIDILIEFSLGKVTFSEQDFPSTTKVKALHKIKTLFDLLAETELKTDEFDTEDYFTDTRFVLILNLRVYLLSLVKSKEAAVSILQSTLKLFNQTNEKHKCIREKCYEMAVNLNNFFPDYHKPVFQLISNGIEEFPHNLHLLKSCALNFSISWLELRRLMSKTLTTNSLIFQIVAARCRSTKASKDLAGQNFETSGIDCSEAVYKKRITNLLHDACNSKIRQNALVWRFYLRALFDVHSNSTLTKCRNILYEALDVCPWSKALYLDGSFFAPQELGQLQDLIIEKQLRIHALPEELQILRND